MCYLTGEVSGYDVDTRVECAGCGGAMLAYFVGQALAEKGRGGPDFVNE